MCSVTTLTEVESLIGAKILLDKSGLAELEDGYYRLPQLVGLQVVDARLGLVGRLVDIFTTAAHDTYIIEGDGGEIMIPAVPEMIIDIDLEGQVMEVDLPDGLVSINR